MATPSTARRAQLPVLATPAAHAPLPGLPAPVDPNSPRIGVVTLGCDKNTVDTERLLARLAHAGANVEGDVAAADIVIINTCGFIDVAKEESVDTILDAIRLKQAGRLRAVVAMGCLVQRYRTDLQEELPEVDLFLGLTEAERLVPELRARGLLPAAAAVPAMERPLRMLSTSTPHTSYLKVSEGCDHGCAFCAIPLMRGKHRSTPIEVLVREAKELERSGVVELNLISQDTTWYGRDILRGAGDVTSGEWFVGRPFAGMAGEPVVPVPRGRATADAAHAGAARHGLLPELLRALLEATSIPWFRLFYMYPSGIYREFVELMAAEPRIVPYIDMPIQHGSDTMLRRMRRPERQATIRERVAWLRDAVPELALRTTVIVGFPGETDEEFDDMLTLLEELRFDHVGAFSYSVEEQTPAAQMSGRIPAALKRERLERLLELQRSIAHERNEEWLGRDVTVLIDGLTGRDSAGASTAAWPGAVGRTARHALEIDGVVHLEKARGVEAGQFVRARVVEVVEDDMRAELISDTGD